MRIETTSRTIYKFNELSDSAKVHALEKQSQFESECWDGDYTIDDIKTTADMFGLRIDQFYYSGFYSQGDGASFKGFYSYKKGALAAIVADRPKDTELHDIVKTLQDIQRKYFYQISCSIIQRGHYYHENTIYIDELLINNDDANFDTDALESDILEMLRKFAQWSYSLLEREYNYQISEEICRENILANEYEFDENGDMV